MKDTAIKHWLNIERDRQVQGLEMIASENYVSQDVLEAQGSLLTNKYAEGYPGKRYYGGCFAVDEVEKIAIERLTKLFGVESANVQPHSGSQANMAVYFSCLKPGDKIVGMNLSQGGHLTHGSPVNFSGKWYQVSSYGVDPVTHRIDYDQVRDVVKKERPKLLIAGASSYPRQIDFETMGVIARENGCEFLTDIAHIAGLVATGLHPTPVGHATYITSTTHKTLRGPRGGVIFGSAEKMKAINSMIFPGIQGGPLMHVIAAKAVAFGEALDPSFKVYQKQVILNAQALAQELLAGGAPLLSGGTDNHLLVVNLTQYKDGSISGKEAEAWLEAAHITTNKNSVPNDPRPPMQTSGIRIGTPALTTRGMKEPEMKRIGRWILEILESKGNTATTEKISKQIKEMNHNFPVPGII